MTHTAEQIEMVQHLQALRQGDEKPGAIVLRALRQLRPDLTPEQKAEALRIGHVEFKSAGAVRKR